MFFQEFVHKTMKHADSLIYVHAFSKDLWDAHSPAHDHLRETRIQFCRGNYPNRILVLEGAGFVKFLDSFAEEQTRT